MTFTEKYAQWFRRLLPSPFTIAILLTFFIFIVALLFGTLEGSVGLKSISLLDSWQKGLWNNGLLVFAMQMMLMLVLGHVLALSRPINNFISIMTNRYCNSTSQAAFTVTFLTIVVSLFNWGLGLIFGAIFARKVGERAKAKGMALNYPLIGAAGYSGLMVWHGGISGSSLIKISEPGHIRSLMDGIVTESEMVLLPDIIGFDATVFSSMNISATITLLIVLPILMRFLGQKAQEQQFSIPKLELSYVNNEVKEGAEKLDHSKILCIGLGVIMIIWSIYMAIEHPYTKALRFITPNYINFSLFGLGLILHQSFSGFLKSVEQAITGVAGILIQFPLYFGIMGLMTHSGLITEISDFFRSISNATTYPLFTFFSAGLVNIFVPSGGGQWAVQGPIIIKSALSMGIPFDKSIMALAYGDQLTNMLQPFWALPLLGITGLKAKAILPYTLILMLAGAVIFILALLIF